MSYDWCSTTLYIGNYYAFISSGGVFFYGVLAGSFVTATTIALLEYFREVRRSV